MRLRRERGIEFLEESTKKLGNLVCPCQQSVQETAYKITEEVEAAQEERCNLVRILIYFDPPTYQSEQVNFAS